MEDNTYTTIVGGDFAISVGRAPMQDDTVTGIHTYVEIDIPGADNPYIFFEEDAQKLSNALLTVLSVVKAENKQNEQAITLMKAQKKFPVGCWVMRKKAKSKMSKAYRVNGHVACPEGIRLFMKADGEDYQVSADLADGHVEVFLKKEI